MPQPGTLEPLLDVNLLARIAVLTIALAGVGLPASGQDDLLEVRLQQRQRAYEANPEDPDALIWYGRFMAYGGDYEGAIELYTRGIEQFPDDVRMLRHRGHRYISIRDFDRAIEDLELAAGLIEGTDDAIEPDGMPNAKNIPVSTLHGNIWYHLGLAYYLEGDLENALRAYQRCLETSERPDNVVSATHWIYMIQRRLGQDEAAARSLERIDDEMDVIENFAYYRACKFYRGLITLEQLTETSSGDAPQSDAVRYAVANWHLYNGETERARTLLDELIATGSKYSFGFIAAEADLRGQVSSLCRPIPGESPAAQRRDLTPVIVFLPSGP